VLEKKINQNQRIIAGSGYFCRIKELLGFMKVLTKNRQVSQKNWQRTGKELNKNRQVSQQNWQRPD
jgi:hypothetical protein